MIIYSLAKKCKDIQIKSHALADEYYALASEVLRLAHIQKNVDVPQLVMLYDKISNLI